MMRVVVRRPILLHYPIRPLFCIRLFDYFFLHFPPRPTFLITSAFFPLPIFLSFCLLNVLASIHTNKGKSPLSPFFHLSFSINIFWSDRNRVDWLFSSYFCPVDFLFLHVRKSTRTFAGDYHCIMLFPYRIRPD